jgi:hypothetical protein
LVQEYWLMEPYNIPKLAQSYKKGTFWCFEMTVTGFPIQTSIQHPTHPIDYQSFEKQPHPPPYLSGWKAVMPDLFNKPLFNILNSNTDYFLNFDFCNIKVPLQAQALNLFADITLLCFFYVIQFNEIFSKITFRPF